MKATGLVKRCLAGMLVGLIGLTILVWSAPLAAAEAGNSGDKSKADSSAAKGDAAADKSASAEPSKKPADASASDGPVDVGKSIVKPGAPGYIGEVHMRDTDIRGALRQLNFDSQVNIITTPEVTGKITVDLYRVTFREALEAILRANGYVYVEQARFIYVMTPEQKKAMLESQRKLSTQLFRLSYATAADVRVLITPLLSQAGSIAITPKAESGITTSSTEAGGNNYATDDLMVVTDYEENLRRVAIMIREVDVRPDQILIEATILRATLDDSNALGMELNMVSGVDWNKLSATTPGMDSLTPGVVSPGSFERPAASFRTDVNGGIPAGGLSIGLISNNVAFFVRALESVTDTTVLANPKLLVINKQRGEVMVGNKDGYITTTFTETSATQEVKFLETGTRLVVRPFIGRDGFIRMEIHPEDSSGSVSVVGTVGLPRETTTEVTSNIQVRDGHTIAIGGLFRERTSSIRSHTPLLGNIPYLGALWRSTTDGTVREEVIILITPRIIRQGPDEAEGEQLRDQIERFRVGHRKGLRWWGRGRLAQRCIRKARAALARGDRKKAMWHVDMALSLRPRLAEALLMKEQLTGRAYWADFARESSAKYMIQRMIMNELKKPRYPAIIRLKPIDASQMEPDVRKAFGAGPNYSQPADAPAADPPADKASAQVDDASTTDVETSEDVAVSGKDAQEAGVDAGEGTDSAAASDAAGTEETATETVTATEADAAASEPDATGEESDTEAGESAEATTASETDAAVADPAASGTDTDTEAGESTETTTASEADAAAKDSEDPDTDAEESTVDAAGSDADSAAAEPAADTEESGVDEDSTSDAQQDQDESEDTADSESTDDGEAAAAAPQAESDDEAGES